MRISDWSSDVCSSDLVEDLVADRHAGALELGQRVAVHRRLGDRRGVGPAPEVLVRTGLVHVPQVGDEAICVLRRESGLQLDDGALVDEVAPDDRVEAAVPETLAWGGGGVGHGEPARAGGAPKIWRAGGEEQRGKAG